MMITLLGSLAGHRGPILDDYNYDTPIEPLASRHRAEWEIPHGGTRPNPAVGPSQPWFDPLLTSFMNAKTDIVGKTKIEGAPLPSSRSCGRPALSLPLPPKNCTPPHANPPNARR